MLQTSLRRRRSKKYLSTNGNKVNRFCNSWPLQILPFGLRLLSWPNLLFSTLMLTFTQFLYFSLSKEAYWQPLRSSNFRPKTALKNILATSSILLTWPRDCQCGFTSSWFCSEVAPKVVMDSLLYLISSCSSKSSQEWTSSKKLGSFSDWSNR